MTSSVNPLHPQVSLRRFINEITDGPFGSSLTSSHYSDDGARVIRLGNIGAARFKNFDAAYISLEYFRNLRRHEVKSGDLIIAGLGDDNHPVGRACVAPPDLGPSIVKADCFRARLDESRLTHRYAAWALSSSVVANQVSTLTRGSTRARINLEMAREIKLPVPPLEEQRRIADFLDTETAHIDDLVAKRRQMRSLLALKRERVIESTLGLERAQTAHGLVPLKYLVADVTVGIVITPAKWYVKSGGTPALRGLNVKPGYINTNDLVQISTEGHAENRKSKLNSGDLVIVRTGQAGATAVVPPELDGSNCIDLIVVRPGKKMSPEYLQYALNSGHARAQVAENAVGSIQAHFNVGAMKQIPLPSVPRTKQEEIVHVLDERVGALDRLCRQLILQEDLLRERRQALITAAVTGQFDVSTASGRGVPTP